MNRNRPFDRVRTYARAFPVSAALIAACVLLTFAAVAGECLFPAQRNEITHLLGSITPRVFVQERELSGPLALWAGEFWRIPINGFQHSSGAYFAAGRLDVETLVLDVIHLLMNCGALAFLAPPIERRLGSLRFLLFCLATTIAASVPTLLLGPVLPEGLEISGYSKGISGLAYALFGFLVVLRRYDRHAEMLMTDQVVRFGFAWFAFCVLLTYTSPIKIDNVAHAAGLAYGYLCGQVVCAAFSAERLVRWGFVAGHLLLVPAVYAVVHPAWVARYQWYRAMDASSGLEMEERLQRAVALDPHLVGAWHWLIELQSERGDDPLAWETTLRALDANRTDMRCLREARRLWVSMYFRGLHDEALETLAQVFPNDTQTWLERILPRVRETPPSEHVDVPDFDPLTPIVEQLRRQARELYETIPDPPAFDPDSPDSAAEGVTL